MRPGASGRISFGASTVVSVHVPYIQPVRSDAAFASVNRFAHRYSFPCLLRETTLFELFIVYVVGWSTDSECVRVVFWWDMRNDLPFRGGRAFEVILPSYISSGIPAFDCTPHNPTHPRWDGVRNHCGLTRPSALPLESHLSCGGPCGASISVMNGTRNLSL